MNNMVYGWKMFLIRWYQETFWILSFEKVWDNTQDKLGIDKSF